MRWRWWAACWAVCGPGLGWGATIVATLTSAVSLARPRARATDDGLLLSPSPAPAAARAHSWPAGPVRSRERRAALYWSEGDHRLPLQVVSCGRSSQVTPHLIQQDTEAGGHAAITPQWGQGSSDILMRQPVVRCKWPQSSVNSDNISIFSCYMALPLKEFIKTLCSCFVLLLKFNAFGFVAVCGK